MNPTFAHIVKALQLCRRSVNKQQIIRCNVFVHRNFASEGNKSKPLKIITTVDLNKSPEQQPVPVHNRWHPLIPPVATVNPGDVFRLECLDAIGGVIKNDDSIEDINTADPAGAHYLSGPIEVNGAEPGDLLAVDILDAGAFPHSNWGFTGIFAKDKGGGFLTDHYPKAAKAIWDFEGRYATSRHVPHVRFAGFIHPGLIGCSPSQELLDIWNKREKELFSTNPDREQPFAALPTERGAVVGKLRGSLAERAIKEGARTIPPRENGGNCDIKNLTIGSRLYLPIFVKGANLSVGDLHFSQGDGEIALCGAIEMAGWIDLKVDLIKNGVNNYNIKNPVFSTSHFGPMYSDYLTFEGISVDENGKQHYLDATLAYKQACLNAIEYLKKFGFTGEQAYLLLSAAPVEGRISSIVDFPNACCTLSIPTAIFDFDVKPKK